ncbi:hypothetical protein D3C71_1388410 [compost metagenome]
MVGRFIHNQDIRTLHHQLAEQHATLLTPGQHLHFLLDVVLAEQQTAQHAAHRLLVVFFLLPLAHPVEHRQGVIEFVFVILSVVTDLGIFRPFHGTAVRQLIVHQRFQQGRFTDTVRAQHRHFLAHFNHQVELAEQRTVVETFGQRFHFQRVTEQFFVLFETDERVLTA